MTDLHDALRALPGTLDQSAPTDLAERVRRRSRRSTARRRVATAVAAAACVVAAVTVVPGVVDQRDRALVQQPAAPAPTDAQPVELGVEEQIALLERWSAAAATDPQVQDAPYAYALARVLWTGPDGVVREEDVETWMASDSSGRRRSVPVAGGEPSDDRGRIFGATTLLRAVPADAVRGELFELLDSVDSAQEERDYADRFFDVAAYLLSVPPPSAAWRDAVVGTVVNLKGVRVVDRVPVGDASGRTGTALVRQRDTAPGELRIVLDPRSQVLLGTVVVQSDGTVSERYTPTATGFTDSVDARP